MSFAGVIGLFRARPQEPVGEGGRMALADHLRELRARLLRVALLLTIGIVVAWFFYPQLLNLILGPYYHAQTQLKSNVKTEAYIQGAGGPLLIQLKICALATVVLTSPIWLLEIWGFVVPGLHPNERKWTRLFAIVAGPLFIVGVAVGYYVLPKGLTVLLNFTPANVQSLLEFGEYLTFFTRMLLVFGVAFEVPLFVILLNLAGVVRGRTLARYRPWIVLGAFVFAAVATPSTDPFSMMMLAIPMTFLFMVSEVIARTVDRRRGVDRDRFDDLDDEEMSPLDEDDDDHYGPSGLSEEDD
jgi:sec-independent protein translocase protein TatC